MFSIADKIGVGVYTPAEAAFYARVSSRMMSRWVFGEASGKPVIERELRHSPEKVVTFLDFVQTLAIREVRNRHGISLQRIRQGIDEARQRYGIEYPLARPHTIFLFSDRKGQGHGQIVIKQPDDTDPVEDRYIQLTGNGRGNFLIRQVVELFLDNLAFDPETGLASRYTPLETPLGSSVVLDPRRQFGEPTVNPGGYTAETLWNATNIEGGIEAAAVAYGVTSDEVRLANQYFDMLLQARAA